MERRFREVAYEISCKTRPAIHTISLIVNEKVALNSFKILFHLKHDTPESIIVETCLVGF